MSGRGTPGAGRFACLFCRRGIETGRLDPCGLVIVTNLDRPRDLQKEQTFYCHIECLRSRSADGQMFHIMEPDFATIGDIRRENEEYGDEDDDEDPPRVH